MTTETGVEPTWFLRPLRAIGLLTKRQQQRLSDSGFAVDANLPVELRLVLILRIGSDEYQATVSRLSPAGEAKLESGLSVGRGVVNDLLQVAPTVVEKLLEVAWAKP